MVETQELIQRVYAAFNARDVEGALVLMRDDVSWPKASEGGRVVGKDEIRAYWGRQWQEFDPHVEPVEVMEEAAGRLRVRVHQLVKSLGGEVLFTGEVVHVYTVVEGLIARMELGGEEAGGEAATAAFTRV